MDRVNPFAPIRAPGSARARVRPEHSLALLLLLAALIAARLAAAAPPPFTIYLPLVGFDEPFAWVTPIWAHQRPPAEHEVALFRAQVSLREGVTSAALQIFADTRYEAWVDGAFVGRGPARFSQQTREYDTIALGALGPGSHTLAILVQWAPNTRRSESTAPHLQARLINQATGRVVAAPAPDAWRVRLSDAWRPGAARIHAWGILGPSEILDLRRLPADWNRPGFNDSGWPAALPVAVPPAQLLPRSIPALANVPIPVGVVERGLIAPDAYLGELPISAAAPGTYRFVLREAATVTIRALGGGGLDPGAVVRLNGAPLAWAADPSGLPDSVRATVALDAGSHLLSAAPAPGSRSAWTFTISRQELLTPPPLGQGLNAGPRTLLPTLAPQSGRVAATTAPLSLSFPITPSYAILDLGRTVHGRIEAQLSGPAGAIVDIGWDERLWRGRRPLPFPGSLHREWNQTDSWALDGAARRVATIDARAGRYLLIAVWGPGPVTIDQLRVSEERYPFTLRGRFSSSSPLLNQIWQVGVDTLMSNMTDAYADAWRERGQWWGDAHVADHVNQVAFGEVALLRRGVGLIAETARDGSPLVIAPSGAGHTMIDYAMLWVQSVDDYGRISGDTDLLRAQLPAIRTFLAALERRTSPNSGLIELPPGPWQNTAYIDTLGWFDRSGQSTAVNAHYYGTLLAAARIAGQVGDSAQADAYTARAAQLREQINRSLFDPQQGAYLAARTTAGPVAPTPHAQALALAYGLPPVAETDRVADALLRLVGPPEQPRIGSYVMFWALEGLARAGRQADALDLIERFYGRLIDRGAVTWWENFTSDERFSDSLSHAWSGSPTWFLTTHILGAQRTGPDTWRLRPALGTLAEASGSLPLASGVLRASWRSTGCGRYTLHISAPESAAGQVVVPLPPATSRVTLNGTPAWEAGRPLLDSAADAGDSITIAVAGRGQQIEISGPCGP